MVLGAVPTTPSRSCAQVRPVRQVVRRARCRKWSDSASYSLTNSDIHRKVLGESPISGRPPSAFQDHLFPARVRPPWSKAIALRSLVITARPVRSPSGQRQPGPRCSPAIESIGVTVQNLADPTLLREPPRAAASLTPHPILVEITATTRVSPSVLPFDGEDRGRGPLTLQPVVAPPP